jgi:hypothetical protein
MSKLIAMAALFIVSIIAQISFIHSLPYPFTLLPLHFIIGIIVMHRSNDQSGIIWFIATPLFIQLFASFTFEAFWAHIAVALFGYLLTSRIFTTRSVYALEGLGLSLFTAFALSNAIIHLFNIPVQLLSVSELFYSLLFLIIGLYIGFTIAKYIEHLAARVFLIRT